MSAPSQFYATVNYFCRAGLYRHVQAACTAEEKRRGRDPVLSFWRAFGLAMEGETSKALRAFEELQQQPDVALASTLAAAHTHRMCRLVDDEALEALELTMGSIESGAKQSDLLVAATFLFHTKEWNKARELARKILDVQAASTQAQALHGWVDLMCGRETLANKSIKFFEAAAGEEAGRKDVDGLLGKAKYLQLVKRNFKGSYDCLGKAAVLFDGFLPALEQKCLACLVMGDWEQAHEIAASQLLPRDSTNLEALRVEALYALVWKNDGKTGGAAAKIGDLAGAIDRLEPNNVALLHKTSKQLSKLCGRDPGSLAVTIGMIRRARELDKNTPQYASEHANQLLMQGDPNAAERAFRDASVLDESSMDAHYGIIRSQIEQGLLDEAKQQLELLNEIQMMTGKAPKLLFLSALHSARSLHLQKGWKKAKAMANVNAMLAEASTLHFAAVEDAKSELVDGSPEFLAFLDPDWLFQIAQAFLEHMPSEAPAPGEEPPQYVKQGVDVLNSVLKYVPVLLDARMLLAKAQHACGDSQKAKNALQEIAGQYSDFSEANVLLAQICLADEDYVEAQQALDGALAHNFSVRESPLYALVKSRTLESNGDLKAALGVLQKAMVSIRNKRKETSDHDGATVYLRTASIQIELKNLLGATETMDEAKKLYNGTGEEVRIMIADCDLALKRGDVKGAAAKLKAVPKESPHFIQARTTLANVYLTHRNDKRKYLNCFADVIEQNPCAASYKAMGDACMRVNEPAQAIQQYELALQYNPKDAPLASILGRVLVATHDYNKAIKYYAEAMAQSDDIALTLELAGLYLRLQKYPECASTLQTALSRGSRGRPKDDVECYLLMSRMHKLSNKYDLALEALQQARVLVDRLHGDGSTTTELKKTVYFALGEFCHQSGTGKLEQNVRDAELYYTTALEVDRSHLPSRLALCQLFKETNDLNKCQYHCAELLKVDPSNSEASMMHGEVMFLRFCQEDMKDPSSLDSAIYHFQLLLEQQPEHYSALFRLLQLLKHSGRLGEAQRYFQLAERAAPSDGAPGLHFCQGVHLRLTCKHRDALREFSKVRNDMEWGAEALYNMVEILLEGKLDEMQDDSSDGNNSGPDNASTARGFLGELSHGASNEPRAKRLRYYAMIATGEKSQIEQAIRELQDMTQGPWRDNVPAQLCVACAFMALKQQTKARNFLKTINRAKYNFEQADDFEKAWLMLASTYIKSGKHDVAEELCRKCLKYNQSCSRACQYLGHIKEKDQAYIDAADKYMQAWQLEGESSPEIGFSLAFNLLKSRRFVEAIDVCHKVLATDSEYPKLRKDVLEKARQGLRG